jgi:hypothetical protein
MLMYAYNRVKAKNPRAIIKANTNTLATALITSLVDIRLVGEAIDATGMDEISRRWLHSSYRLGETTEFLWDQTPWSFAQKASFAALVTSCPRGMNGLSLSRAVRSTTSMSSARSTTARASGNLGSAAVSCQASPAAAR